MARRRLAPAANSRNSRRSLRASRATRRYGTATPTDEQIRAQAASDRGQAFSRARVAAAEAKKNLRQNQKVLQEQHNHRRKNNQLKKLNQQKKNHHLINILVNKLLQMHAMQ